MVFEARVTFSKVSRLTNAPGGRPDVQRAHADESYVRGVAGRWTARVHYASDWLRLKRNSHLAGASSPGSSARVS